MTPTGVRLFALLPLLIGGGLLFAGVRLLLRAHASNDWPTVMGKVVSSSVDSSRSKDHGTTYHAEVLYEFTVRGTHYSSNDIAVGGYSSSNPARARRLVNQYPAGDKVIVHYSPSDPETSLLEPGIASSAFFLPGVGAFFFAIGLWMFICLPGTVVRARMTGLRHS
jgi:Protein of unknown function (DUF3592)